MRNIDRIEKITEELKYYWHKYPDMRLCQLIYCITEGKDIFNIEDEKFLELLSKWDRKKFKENLERASETVKSWPKWKQDLFGLSRSSTSPDGIIESNPPNIKPNNGD